MSNPTLLKLASVMCDYIKPHQFLLVGIVVVLTRHFLFGRILPNNRISLPPGPPYYPLIGQFFSFPRTLEGPELLDLSIKLRSDIVCFSILGTTIVVLNSAQATVDLLKKNAKKYSGRFCPPMISSSKLMDLQNFMPFMDSGEAWKNQRKTIGLQLNAQSVHKFRPSGERQAREFLRGLLSTYNQVESSQTLDLEFFKTVAAVIFNVVYGYKLESLEDPFLGNTIIFGRNVTQALMPSSFLVNVLPWLQNIPEWIPGMGWKKIAREWRNQKDCALDGPYNWTKQRFIDGVDHYSIVSSILKDAQEMGWNQVQTDEFAKNVGLALLAGGAGLSSTTLSWFLLAMVLYPEVQEKAQREIDEVVGPDRLPTYEDRSNLPFMERLLLETLRWQPVGPLGVPHLSSQDNEYQGYHVPKGAIIIGNIWAISHDSEKYKNPDAFDPDRFLDPNVPAPPAFGWGIRSCPGKFLFRDLFFIQAALLLAAYKIEKFKDKDGREVEPVRKIIHGSAESRPAPFMLRIAPRSNHHAELVRKAE